MPWFKVDDQLAVHMKAITAGNAAMGLWVRAGSWCMAQLTDGFVPDAMVVALGGSVADAESLAAAGLWHPVEGGWQFHDWAEYQPTREQVLAERAATKERVAKHRAKRASNAVTNGGGTTSPSPVPSPDFYSPSKSQSSSNRARVSTDAIPVSPMTKKLAGQLGVTNLRAVVDAVASHCGLTVTADQAYQVAAWILEKRSTPPGAPQRYVTGAIAKSPAEVQKHLYEQIGVAS